MAHKAPHVLSFRVLPGGDLTRIEFPMTADPFAILQRAFDWVDAAGVKMGLDPKREIRENGPRSPVTRPSAAASPTFKAAVRPPCEAPEAALPPSPPAAPAAGTANENPAGNRTTSGPGERSPDQTRESGRTPTPHSEQTNAGSRGDRAEGSGGRELRQPGENVGLDAAPRPGVRDTSMIAYRALRYSGALAKQQREIIDVFLRDPSRDWTRRELVDQVGIPINAVCGRVNELLKEPFELLVELAEKRDCRVTKNRVNALALAEEKPKGER